jgi:hypothetical protein
MAEIKFYGNFLSASDDNLIRHDLGSGIGFYGLDFGISVPVGSQQSTTWITNADGTVAGPKLHNTAKVASGIPGVEMGTVSVDGSSSPITLDKLSNYLCPLNIRFTHSSPVKVQNGKLRIFARDHGISKPASGVTTWVYEARKPSSTPSTTSLSHRGITHFVWTEFEPLAAQLDLPLTPSPGMSGQNTSTADTDADLLKFTSQSGQALESSRHDWYIALSSEPEGIGSKTNYGLYYTVEYL